MSKGTVGSLLASRFRNVGLKSDPESLAAAAKQLATGWDDAERSVRLGPTVLRAIRLAITASARTGDGRNKRES